MNKNKSVGVKRLKLFHFSRDRLTEEAGVTHTRNLKDCRGRSLTHNRQLRIVKLLPNQLARVGADVASLAGEVMRHEKKLQLALVLVARGCIHAASGSSDHKICAWY